MTTLMNALVIVAAYLAIGLVLAVFNARHGCRTWREARREFELFLFFWPVFPILVGVAWLAGGVVARAWRWRFGPGIDRLVTAARRGRPDDDDRPSEPSLDWQAMQAMRQEIEQTLGRALHYPAFRDDPKNFPDHDPADASVCVGDHVPETLAAEAAGRIRKLESEVTELRHVAINSRPCPICGSRHLSWSLCETGAEATCRCGWTSLDPPPSEQEH